MFKRTSKITALLVAVASVMSVVPAMAATNLETKDGTIENAVAFKDGKYLYQGYKTDDDTAGLYYNDGNKDKMLDDATEIDSAFGKYDNKNVVALDGSDQYMVDLSSGSISDSDTAGDLITTAQAKLETKLAKTDRYDRSNVNLSPIEPIETGNNSRDRFGDVWYAYSATTTSAVTASKTTTAAAVNISYTGYANQSGTYIDASKNANIYVFNGERMVKLEDVGDTDTTNNKTVTLDSITYIKTLGQDDKYLYRLIQAHVSGAVAVDGGASDEDLYYVQKISKAQGDQEEDAYLPKSTDSYQIGANMGDSDVKDAYDAIMDAMNNTHGDDYTYIVDGSLYTTFTNDEKVETIKMNFKTSQKLEENSSTKVDGHVVVKDTDKDTKIENTAAGNKSWAVDINGNVWVIKGGEILESTKAGDFKTVYTTDRSFDSIDVYDENNLIAWEDGGDAYTNVTEGVAQATTDAGTIGNSTPANVGWVQAGTAWTFYNATGNKVINNWVNDKGTWYFIGEDGNMATGWKSVGGTWYYLQSTGAMKTGWLNDNGTWYYLQSSGAMKTGWLNDNGTWYYLNASGAMLADTTVEGYTLNASGAWIK